MNLIELYKIIKWKISPGRYGWSGDYDHWDIVQKKSAGYQSHLILEKVRQSVLKVKNGDAVYERDSVLFDKIGYSWPLLSALMWVASKNLGKLNVLDFGGSLGSTYFQNRLFLGSLHEVKWNVVEQAGFVECGRTEIADANLRFFYSSEEVILSAGLPDILILSCVLPYLENPYEMIGQIMGYGFPYILIDNTYFNYEPRDRICLQKVPPEIYPASVPCWFLNYDRLKAVMEEKYSVFSEHMNDSVIFLDGRKIQYRGMLLKKK